MRTRNIPAGLSCLALAALAALGAPSPARAGEAPSYPDLSGTWTLDRGSSDEIPRAGRGGTGGGGPPRGGGGGMRGGHSGGRGGPGSGPAAPDADLAEAAATLTIAHAEPKLTITDGLGRERTVFTDGRKTEEEHSREGTTQVTARWKDARIEIVSKPEHGGKRTERLAVAADRSQLRVTIELEGERSPVTLHLVYVPASAATRPAAVEPPELPPEL